MLMLVVFLHFVILWFSFKENSLIYFSCLLFSGLFLILSRHVSMLLVELELLTLMIISLMILKSVLMSFDYQLLFILMSFAVVEATVGITAMVLSSRTSSKELLSTSF